MKRLLILILLVISSIGAYSQETTTAIVTLKNGKVIEGIIKEFDPTTKIVLSIGGFDTTINMDDVEKVKNVQHAASARSPQVTLPEDTTVNICGVDVKFILMKGGKFMYGFDGKWSSFMDSEPVHEVELTPFYVSEELVSRKLYEAVTKAEYPQSFSIAYSQNVEDPRLGECAFFMSSDLVYLKNVPSAEDFLAALRSTAGEQFDLPTEVQWFYYESGKSKAANKLITPLYIYCQFAYQVSMSDIQDPIGHFVVVKGSTEQDDDVMMYRLHDRTQIKNTNVKHFGQNTWRVSSKGFSSKKALCPIRLVMQAK